MCYSGAATINEGITEETIIVDLASGYLQGDVIIKIILFRLHQTRTFVIFDSW
jgi:hypothetical protein